MVVAEDVDEAVTVGVRLGVGVDVEVADGVKVNVEVGVGVKVGETVTGRKGVLVLVTVGVWVKVGETVLVRIAGVRLFVGVKMLSVPVKVAEMDVLLAVGVIAFGSGANPTAIQPRQ
jgi:hypothetical protein